MERAPFSQAGLRPEEIGRESALVLKSLDAVKDVIHEIDFQVVDDIFLSIYKKVYPEIPVTELKHRFALDGVYPIHVSYSGEVDLSHYDQSFMSKNGGVLGYADSQIKVNAREIVNEDGEVDQGMRLFLVKMLIHEIVHKRTTTVAKSSLPDITNQNTGIEKLSANRRSHITSIASFSALNEALTEIIADGIYSEYFARTGRMSEYEPANREEKFAKRHVEYLPERLALQNLVDKIARDLNVTERRVYEAFIVEYFKNGDLMRSEVLNDESLSDEVKLLLEKLYRNDSDMFPDLREGYELKIINFLHEKEFAAVRAVVGRDYIGALNKSRLVKHGIE